MVNPFFSLVISSLAPLLPLVYASVGTMTEVQLKGEVVLCEGGGGTIAIVKGQQVKNVGGSVMILMNDELEGITAFTAQYARSSCNT